MARSSAPFSDADEPGATRLSRRVGFFIRYRARLGLMPGQVSTAVLIQARGLRRAAWWLSAIVVVIALLPFLFLASSDTTDEPNAIAAVVRPVPGTSPGPYEVVLADGRTMFFARDPGVQQGQVVEVRQRNSRDLRGLIVDGRFVHSTANDGLPIVVTFLLFWFLALALGLAFLPMAIWSRRSYRAIQADLSSGTEESRGRYLGSWTWRALSGGIRSRRQSLGVSSGIPVAIEEVSGALVWFGAPIWMLIELRHFETEIASTDRSVVVTFHPATRALARIASSDGTSVVEFESPLDHLHPETGLSLKVSGRRRHAHLPDR